jgi:hypothetical protein
MNWCWLLECFGIIALANAATLPWAWHLWRIERTNRCENFRLTDCANFKIHAAETQVLPTMKSSKVAITTLCVSTLRLFRRLMRFSTAS